MSDDQQPRGAGARGRLADPKRPDLPSPSDQPLMNVVPPDPTSSDDAGEIDYTHGDPTRVREEPRGSAPSPGEDAADEARRRDLLRRGATNVGKG